MVLCLGIARDMLEAGVFRNIIFDCRPISRNEKNRQISSSMYEKFALRIFVGVVHQAFCGVNTQVHVNVPS